MLKRIVELYLFKKVTVTLFDGETLTGYLHSTDESDFKNIPEINMKPNCYLLTDESGGHVNNLLFRVSHIKNIVEV